MKKLILFSLIMTASLFAFAQKGGGDPEAKIQKKVDRMTAQLNLSADQQARVKTLIANQHKNRKAPGKKRSDLSEEERAAMKVERKAAKAEFDTQLAAILTTEQNETYKNLPKRDRKKGAHKGMKKGKGKKGMGKKTSAERTQSRVAKLTEQLNLTPTQQTQLTELMSNQKSGREKGKELSEEERATMKAERKAQRAAYHAKFEEILTPDQLAKYQELKAERKEKRKKKPQRKESQDRK